VVERVDEVSAELQPDPLREVEVLLQTQINIRISRHPNSASSTCEPECRSEVCPQEVTAPKYDLANTITVHWWARTIPTWHSAYAVFLGS